MFHSFVVPKLVPRLPTWAETGQKVLPSMPTTKPFLALYIQLSKKSVRPRTPNLFVVSNEKPTAPDWEYLILDNANNAGSDRTLTVVPPLPFQNSLYLIITPRISGVFPDTESFELLSNLENYRLDDISLDRFLRTLDQAKPSLPLFIYTGGDDQPSEGSRWSPWEYLMVTEREIPFLYCGIEVQFYFDLVPFKSLASTLTPHVFDESALLYRFVYDYTWKDCERTIEYIQEVRKRSKLEDIVPHSPALLEKHPDPLVDSQRACTCHLKELYSADQKSDDGDQDSVIEERILKWDPPIAMETPAVKISHDIQAIVFDKNVLIDYDGPLTDALTRIFPPLVHQLSPTQLLHLYVEYETLQAYRGKPDSPESIVQNITRYLSVTVDTAFAKTQLTEHGQPRLFSGIHNVIASFQEQGYSLAVLSLLEISPLLHDIPRLTPISPSEDWPDLLVKEYSSVQRSQILVVTSDMYCTGVLASRSGFPTAFVNNPNTRSAELFLPTAPPTLKFPTLLQLLDALQLDPSSLPIPKDPLKNQDSSPPMQFQDCYQVTNRLGSGSFGRVYDTIEIHTGAHVAVKYESREFEDDILHLPYEAAIYSQLEGIPGIPRIHWSDVQETASPIVMDKLGPSLDKLKSFCQGRFMVKTILMIGEQMLSTIEAIHSRGVIIRDIKPSNMAMGLSEDCRQLILFDFGIGELWLDLTTGKHIPFREGKRHLGTTRYASINANLGRESSRRDDIESLGYVLLDFLHGRLPWSV